MYTLGPPGRGAGRRPLAPAAGEREGIDDRARSSIVARSELRTNNSSYRRPRRSALQESRARVHAVCVALDYYMNRVAMLPARQVLLLVLYVAVVPAVAGCTQDTDCEVCPRDSLRTRTTIRNAPN